MRREVSVVRCGASKSVTTPHDIQERQCSDDAAIVLIACVPEMEGVSTAALATHVDATLYAEHVDATLYAEHVDATLYSFLIKGSRRGLDLAKTSQTPAHGPSFFLTRALHTSNPVTQPRVL